MKKLLILLVVPVCISCQDKSRLVQLESRCIALERETQSLRETDKRFNDHINNLYSIVSEIRLSRGNYNVPGKNHYGIDPSIYDTLSDSEKSLIQLMSTR